MDIQGLGQTGCCIQGWVCRLSGLRFAVLGRTPDGQGTLLRLCESLLTVVYRPSTIIIINPIRIRVFLVGQGVFFLLWPLFARAPCHGFLDFVLLSSPGVQRVFFVAPRWAQQKPNGAEQKKNTLHTRGRQQNKFQKPMTRGTSKKGPQQTKKRLTHCGPGPRCSLTSFPRRLFRLVLFFCCGPARTLTHSLRSWAAMPHHRGGAFFCCGPARTGVVFFFSVAPPGCSLTHCGLGRFRQGPGVFCLLRPRRTRRANNKKCLLYYIGSKTTRRGHSKKKKKHHFPTSQVRKVLKPTASSHFAQQGSGFSSRLLMTLRTGRSLPGVRACQDYEYFLALRPLLRTV